MPNFNALLLSLLFVPGSHADVRAEASPGGTAGSVFQAPGRAFARTLQHFKLQLPAGNGRGGVQEIKQSGLKTYASRYFYLSAGAMVFWCPDDGASTAGSHYPRSELRDNREWRIDASRSMTGTARVLQQPSSGRIIFAQIHGRSVGSEALKLRWTNGGVLASVKRSLGGRDESIPLLGGLHPGDAISFSILQADHRLTVTVNGVSVTRLFDSSWDRELLYFKAGNYLQDNSRSGSSGSVAYDALSTAERP
jgi:hypothetical protein